MARKRKSDGGAIGSPAWMTTYSDLVTLLLCFFVMLYASSNVDVAKLEAMAASFRSASQSILPNISSQSGAGINTMLGSGIMEMPSQDLSARELREEYERAQQELSQMASDFKTYFAENNLTSVIDVELTSTYVLLEFKDGLLFDKGRADLKPEALEALDLIASELSGAHSANDIIIEGHTDSDPINTPIFRNNWYLSSARAISVGDYFINEKGIDPQRIAAQGFGEYRPKAENDTEANKTKNRRVEIKIMSNSLANN